MTGRFSWRVPVVPDTGAHGDVGRSQPLSAAERSSGDQKETEEDFKRVPPEPLARGGFVGVLTFGLQSEAEREGGQTFPGK